MPQLPCIAIIEIWTWRDIKLIVLPCAVRKKQIDILMQSDAGAEKEEAEDCRGLKMESSCKGTPGMRRMMHTRAEVESLNMDAPLVPMSGLATGL